MKLHGSNNVEISAFVCHHANITDKMAVNSLHSKIICIYRLPQCMEAQRHDLYNELLNEQQICGGKLFVHCMLAGRHSDRISCIEFVCLLQNQIRFCNIFLRDFSRIDVVRCHTGSLMIVAQSMTPTEVFVACIAYAKNCSNTVPVDVCVLRFVILDDH